MPETKQQAKKFKVLLEEKGLKYTYERKFIFEEVLHVKEHFDADRLYERFKKKGLRISRDTVYRTIPLLLESGVIQKSVGEGKREFYERTSGKGHHDHIFCIHCQKIIEFTCDEIERLQEKICADYDFKLIFHDHRLFGYCRECQAHTAEGAPGFARGSGAVPARGFMPRAGGRAKRGPLTVKSGGPLGGE